MTDHAAYQRAWEARRKAAGYVRVRPKVPYVRQPPAKIPSIALVEGRNANLPAMFRWMLARQAAKRKRQAQIVNRGIAKRRKRT